MALGRVPKIYIGWATVIAIGLGSFVVARDSVAQNRYAIMKTRERIRDQARSEQEQARAASQESELKT